MYRELTSPLEDALNANQKLEDDKKELQGKAETLQGQVNEVQGTALKSAVEIARLENELSHKRMSRDQLCEEVSGWRQKAQDTQGALQAVLRVPGDLWPGSCHVLPADSGAGVKTRHF